MKGLPCMTYTPFKVLYVKLDYRQLKELDILEGIQGQRMTLATIRKSIGHPRICQGKVICMETPIRWFFETKYDHGMQVKMTCPFRDEPETCTYMIMGCLGCLWTSMVGHHEYENWPPHLRVNTKYVGNNRTWWATNKKLKEMWITICETLC